MPPTFANGKVCYLEIPAIDISASADFYAQAVGWTIRQRDNGTTAFDDGVAGVSGAWVLDRPPSSTPGILVYIMVDSVATTCDRIVELGAEIVQPIGGDPGEITARFRDPAGNILGLYQHPL